MYGSYGSYSSMCASSAPIDITSGLGVLDANCAFPSWPRRSSLSESDREERPTSFLSDDDLLLLSDPFDDDSQSISSAGSTTPRSVESLEPQFSDADLAEMERQKAAMQRQFIQQIINEKERRRQAAKSKRRSNSSSGSSKKSPKSKLSSMTPISE